MTEIKLNKRYKFAGDIFHKLIEIGFDFETAKSFLNDIEDADVVEVVRCEDCEYRGNLKCPMFSYEHREWAEDYIIIDNTENDGFCCYGKRELKMNKQNINKI